MNLKEINPKSEIISDGVYRIQVKSEKIVHYKNQEVQVL